MSRLIQILLALALAGAALTAAAQSSYYDPDESGHGVTVQAVGDRYVAQWYFHDGQQTRWVASDVCHYGESCEVWTVRASGFPARRADLVEAGAFILDRTADGALLTYDLEIEGVDCSQVLPGPLPAECVNPDGSRNWDHNDTFSAAGAIELDVLIE